MSMADMSPPMTCARLAELVEHDEDFRSALHYGAGQGGGEVAGERHGV
jgi:hypothetical protein